MGDVLTFAPRPRPPELAIPTDLDLRAQIEEAAQVAVDTAQRLIDILDRMDGDTDLEDGGEAEPSLAAPENHTGSQVVWMRGNDQDREAGAPEDVLPEVAAELVSEPDILPWRGRGNIITAAGALILDMLERA